MQITTAQREWFARPEDERFESLEAMYQAALRDKADCVARTVPVQDVRAKATEDGRVILNGKTNAASLTHWSFGQVASLAGAPAGYLRTLPADLAAAALNVGLDRLQATRSEHQLYFRAPMRGDGIRDLDQLQVRAVTSTDYGRIHDADIINRLIHVQQNNPKWHLPMDWNNKRSGAFRGDRDMTVLMVDGGSIVEDPTLTDGSQAAIYRGFILRNSEVGAAALSIQTFQFRYVCGNLCIWGAQNVRTIRRRHVGDPRAIAYRIHAGIDTAERFARRPASEDVHAIRQLAAVELGKDRDETIQAGRAAGLTIPQATAAYEQAEIHEHSPRSVWGYTAGITRASQLLTSGYQDARVTMDQIAGAMLTSWSRKVLA